MYGWLHFIRNDKLDSGGLERVFRIEPDHELKNLILGKIQKNATSDTGGKRRGDRRGTETGAETGVGTRSSRSHCKPNRIETKRGTLYKLSPRTSIEKNHVLRSSACNSWIPVRDARCAIGITGEGRKEGGERKGGNGDGARRTSRSLCGIGLFDLDFLQLLLQPSRVDDGHGARWWRRGEVRLLNCLARVGGHGTTGPWLC